MESEQGDYVDEEFVPRHASERRGHRSLAPIAAFSEVTQDALAEAPQKFVAVQIINVFIELSVNV